eukprot:scaffold2111_cov36-Phaeocystis_antarctica.AAC.1
MWYLCRVAAPRRGHIVVWGAAASGGPLRGGHQTTTWPRRGLHDVATTWCRYAAHVLYTPSPVQIVPPVSILSWLAEARKRA